MKTPAPKLIEVRFKPIDPRSISDSPSTSRFVRAFNFLAAQHTMSVPSIPPDMADLIEPIPPE